MKEKLTPRPKTCLEAINQHLENLGSTTRWKKAPSDLPKYQSLHRKKVLLVDDQLAVIETFIPHLTVATENNFSFILCSKNDSLSELAQQIAKEKADLILLDYHISSTFKGDDLARLIKKSHKGLLIGFSSDRDSKQHWIAAKVYARIEKNADEPIESIKSLAFIASDLDLDEANNHTGRIIKPNIPLSLVELELRGDRDSGVANYQHVPGHGDTTRAERENAILYLAKCVNTMIVYKKPQDGQKELAIDTTRTKADRENYLRSKAIPNKSSFYPKGYGIIRDENGLPVFGKIK